MAKGRRSFPDDLDSTKKVSAKEKSSKLKQFTKIQDKWNAIQEDYINSYPDLEIEDLYFESGGFEGLLEKISEVRNIPVEEVRSEIEHWHEETGQSEK